MRTQCRPCVITISIVLLSIGICQGVEGDLSKSSSKASWGMPVDDMRLSLRSSRVSFLDGEKVEVKIFLQNVGNKDRDVVNRYAFYSYAFDVVGPDGKKTPLTARGMQLKEAGPDGYRAVSKLRPMEEHTCSLVISEVFEMKKLGKYRITASRSVEKRSDPKNLVTVTSNPLAITIAPPKEKKGK